MVAPVAIAPAGALTTCGAMALLAPSTMNWNWRASRSLSIWTFRKTVPLGNDTSPKVRSRRPTLWAASNAFFRSTTFPVSVRRTPQRVPQPSSRQPAGLGRPWSYAGAHKEAGADDTEQVGRHAEADVESGGAMQEKGLWHEGDTSNDTFLKAVSGYRRLPATVVPQELRRKLERVKGIEPSSVAWEATALPLSYTRIGSGW